MVFWILNLMIIMVNICLKSKVKKLRDQIDDLRHRYHVLNDPQVTDKMYEGLMDELRKIEDEHPELITPESPTQRVAGEVLEKFEKVRHQVPQWSFNDAFDRDDLDNWQERILKILEKKLGHRPGDIDYICEVKIDGLHIVLTYEDGKLKTAATRGDGKVGENVTQNIKTINSVPLKLKQSLDIIVEGEVWMSDKILKKINKKREKNNETPFANPRNAAAGTIRQLDPKIVAERNLKLSVYDISGGNIPETQAEELKQLKKMGFLTDDNWEICKTPDEIMNYHKNLEKKKNKLDFWVDGVVIKVNQKKYQDLLGFTGKAPRWAIALKFPAEQGTTKIIDIYVQVGRTGALTPVALMEPVKLAGTTVTHATLHNFDEVERLDVRVGDRVVVEKAGDIIPKVVKVLDKLRSGDEKKVKIPTKCPICGSKVKRKDISDKKQEKSAALFCTNKNCYAKELERISHFVSKKAFDIDGMGKKIVEQLVNEGLVKNAADIFNLTKGDLEPLERFAEKSADNLITAIEESKKITLPRFIFALGINHVGEETAQALAEHFGTWKKIENANKQKFEEVPDIGPRVAESLQSFLDDKQNKKLLSELFDLGVKIKKYQSNKNGKLNGKTFVLTGSLDSFTRSEAKAAIIDQGGHVSSSVSRTTDYVLVGGSPGSKYDKAKDLGIKIINENQFKKILG
ncbi:MAG: NAD-dependent DNA ligase LigA [Candidatus Magasanikbacteria bacterium]|nr:NAD-dependent DNA ligase LigA [Candidatus Magasanikbacteria bacterium]